MPTSVRQLSIKVQSSVELVLKRARRVNTVMPVNTAMPMFPTSFDRNAHMEI